MNTALDKQQIPELTMELFVKEFIESEERLRSTVFLKGRKLEIKPKGGFDFLGITIEFCLLQKHQLIEDYEIIENKPICKMNINANYKICKNERWANETRHINNGIGLGLYYFPVLNKEEFESLKETLSEVGNHLGNQIYFNWRNALPILKTYFDNSKKEANLFAWISDHSIKYVWAKSYKEVSTIVNSIDGYIRMLSLPKDFKIPIENGLAQESDIINFMVHGNMNSTNLLKQMVEKENERDRQASGIYSYFDERYLILKLEELK
jgi:hypothetical protein